MDFANVESVWSGRLVSLRNRVRQHVISEQLSRHLSDANTILDVGCGQGTQAVALAMQGKEVVGVDPSEHLLEALHATADSEGVTVQTLCTSIGGLHAALGEKKFEAVLAHGLLMYLPDAEVAIESLSKHVKPGGVLSITFRNGDALAYRYGLRGEWRRALASFESNEYINELGADTKAHSLAEISTYCERRSLQIEAWYGVRVFTEGVPVDLREDAIYDLQHCLAAEVEAGQRDPYRAMGSQLHLIARMAQKAPD